MSKRIRNVLKRILVFSLVAVLLVGCGTTSTDEPVDSSVEVTDDANDTVVEDTTTEDVVEDDATTEEEVVEDDATTEEEVVEEDTTTEEEVVEEDNLDTALFVYDGVNNKQIDIPVVDLLPDYVAGDTIRVTAVMSGDGGYTGGLGICKGDNYEWNQVDYAHFDGGQHTWEMVVTPTSPDIAVMVWTVEGTYVILKDIKVVKADPSEIVEEAPVEIDLDYTFDGAANRQIDIPVTSILPDFQYGDAIKVKATLTGDGGYAGGLGICVGSNYDWNQVQYDCWDGGTNTWEMVVVPSSPDVAVMVWTVQGTYVHLDSFSITYADAEEAAEAEEKAAIASIEYSKNPLTGEIFWTALEGDFIKLWRRADIVEPQGNEEDPRQFTIDLNENPEFKVGATIRVTMTVAHNANFVADMVTSSDLIPGWHPVRVQQPGCSAITNTWVVTPNVDWLKLCCWWMEGSEVALVDYDIEVLSDGKTAPALDVDDVLGNLADAEEFIEAPVTVPANRVAVTVPAEDLGLADMRTNDTIVVAYESDAEPVLWLFHPIKGTSIIEPSYVEEAVATYATNGATVKYAVFTGWDMKAAVGGDFARVTEVMVVSGAAATTFNSLAVSGETVVVVNEYTESHTFETSKVDSGNAPDYSINLREKLGGVSVGDVVEVTVAFEAEGGNFNGDLLLDKNLYYNEDGTTTVDAGRGRFDYNTNNTVTCTFVVGDPEAKVTVGGIWVEKAATEVIEADITVKRLPGMTANDIKYVKGSLSAAGTLEFDLADYFDLTVGDAFRTYTLVKGGADTIFKGDVNGTSFDVTWSYGNGEINNLFAVKDVDNTKLAVTVNEIKSEATKQPAERTLPVYVKIARTDEEVHEKPAVPEGAVDALDNYFKEANITSFLTAAGGKAGDKVKITVELSSPEGDKIQGQICDNNGHAQSFEHEAGGNLTVELVAENVGGWIGVQSWYCASYMIIESVTVEVLESAGGDQETGEPLGTMTCETEEAKKLSIMSALQAYNHLAGESVVVTVNLEAQESKMYKGIMQIGNDSTVVVQTDVEEVTAGGVGTWVFEIDSFPAEYNWAQLCLHWCEVPVTVHSIKVEKAAEPLGTMTCETEETKKLSIMSALQAYNHLAGESVVVTVNLEAQESKMYKGIMQIGNDSTVVVQTDVEEVTAGGVGTWVFEIDSFPAEYNWAQLCLHWCEVPVTVHSIEVTAAGNNSASAAALVNLLGL